MSGPDRVQMQPGRKDPLKRNERPKPMAFRMGGYDLGTDMPQVPFRRGMPGIRSKSCIGRSDSDVDRGRVREVGRLTRRII